MAALVSIRRALADPRELERGVLMRRVGIVLNLAGFGYALCFAALFATSPTDAVRIAACACGFGVLSLALWRLPPRGEYATVSALIATANIGVILTARDATATVPLFYLWPLTALAYFHSPRFLAYSIAWMAVTLAPALLVDGTSESRTIYLGAVSTATLVAALVAVMRHDEQRLRRSLLHGSTTDSLTGLLNRRSFTPAYAETLATARTRGDGVSIVLIDLDHFKRFNDTHGHLAGDAALRRVAAVLQAAARPGDLVARLGGEEFALILPGRGAAAAHRMCDRIAATLGPSTPEPADTALDRAVSRSGPLGHLAAVSASDEAAQPPHAGTATLDPLRPGAPIPALTASYGIVHTSPRGQDDGETLLGNADAALYAAKRSGRDRVGIWSGGRTLLSAPMHVAGMVTVGTAEPLDAADVPHRSEPDPATIVARRGKVLFRAASAMFVAGGFNALAGVVLLPMPPSAARWQIIIGSGLIALGLFLAFVRGSVRYAGTIGFVGIAAVSAVVATVDPLISAPLFYTWPVAMVAYFARPKVVAWAVAWVAVTLVCGLWISVQPVDELGMTLGALINVAMLAGLITGLRWREDRLSEGLERSAAIDPLTGALTRRAFLPAVEGWLGAPTGRVAVLLVDLDHFKRYNDEHGHLAGDEALRRAARALHAGVPEGALVCRFGGEEFAIAIPGGGMRLARDCADQIAEELAAQSPADLTISAGIAVAQPGETALDRVIGRADQGLYAAKGAGRARVAWFARDADEQLVVSEPIHVARPAAFRVFDGLGLGDVPGSDTDLSSAA